MHTLSLNRIAVPNNLSAITDFDTTVNGDAHSDAIWQAVERLYSKGMNPGISLCLHHKGERVLNRTIGYANGNVFNPNPVKTKQLMSLDTPVCLYSASKAITAMLVHWADEKGFINLLNPVAHYLPEFAQNGKQNITLQQILSHRAGIGALPSDLAIETLYDYDSCIKLVCEAQPDKTHRHRSAYHALTGGYVLSAVLEKATGKDMNQLIDEAFCKPMGMKYFRYGLEEQYRSKVALNYATGMKPVGPLGGFLKKLLGLK